MKFSIIIPVYNKQDSISECLYSCLKQTYHDFEIIVINNNSIDKTLEYLKTFNNIEKKIVLLEEKKQGAGFARNKGIQYAKGDILVFIDADCILDLDFLKNLKNIFENNLDITGVVGFVGAYLCNNIIEKTVALIENNICIKKYNEFKIEKIIGSTSNFSIKSGYFKKNKILFRESCFAEDIDLFARILKKKDIILFSDQVKVFHKHRNNFKEFIYQGYSYGRNLAEYFIIHNDNLCIIHFFSYTLKIKNSFIPVWINFTSPDKIFIYTFVLGLIYKPLFFLFLIYFLYLIFKFKKSSKHIKEKIFLKSKGIRNFELPIIIFLHVLRFFVSNVSSLVYSIKKGCVRG